MTATLCARRPRITDEDERLAQTTSRRDRSEALLRVVKIVTIGPDPPGFGLENPNAEIGIRDLGRLSVAVAWRAFLWSSRRRGAGGRPVAIAAFEAERQSKGPAGLGDPGDATGCFGGRYGRPAALQPVWGASPVGLERARDCGADLGDRRVAV